MPRYRYKTADPDQRQLLSGLRSVPDRSAMLSPPAPRSGELGLMRAGTITAQAAQLHSIAMTRAARLGRATLHLQRRYGNNYVEQAVALARKERQADEQSGVSQQPAGTRVRERQDDNDNEDELTGNPQQQRIQVIGALSHSHVTALTREEGSSLGGFFEDLSRLLFSPLPSSVQSQMRQAWTDSNAASQANRHEEGGYIVRQAGGGLAVERWPRGAGADIQPPARDARGYYNGHEVVGEFHTHPNPAVDEAGKHWVQGPSPTDITGIRAERYSGNSYVISGDNIYLVQPDGSSSLLGSRRSIIGL